MSLEAKIIALATAIGTDVKALTTKQGDLTALSTTAKTNLVVAINEMHAAVSGSIDDTAGGGSTLVTWSADKIFDTIELAKTTVKNDLVAGASTALDTLSELAAALGNDPSFATTIATELGNRLRFDAAQTLSGAQKLQACQNVGVGNYDRNFTADYTAAKA